MRRPTLVTSCLLGLVTLLIVASAALGVSTTRYVANSGSDAANDCTIEATPCQTIQYAIGQAVAGDTVQVAAGTYDEQVVIDKDLTLQGAGNTTILRPASAATMTSTYTYPAGNFFAGTVMSSIVLAKDSAAVTVKDLKIDGVNVTTLPAGADRLAGILYGESGGVVDNVSITTLVVNSYTTRTYGIDLSSVNTARSVEVKDSDISDWSRNGIQVQGDAMTADIHDNTLTGPGDTLNASAVPNGILFIGGADGNATTNTISGMHTTATGSRSAGVIFYDPLTAGIVVEDNDISDVDDGVLLGHNSNDVIVRNNNLHDNAEVGVHLEDGTTNNAITGNFITGNDMAGIRFAGATDPGTPDTPPGTGNYAHGNAITANGAGPGAAVVDYDTQSFDASANWWGTNTPAGVAAENVGDVDYTPWLNSGTDTSVAAGFQGDFSYLNVDDDSIQIGLLGRIQEAVDLVTGSTVNVMAGTYDEQVVIDGMDLTLQGAGATTVIRPSSPATLTDSYAYPAGMYAPWTGVVISSVIQVTDTDAATIKDLVVDGVNVTTLPGGAARVAGILYGNSGGVIDNVTITTLEVDGYTTRSYGIDLNAGGTARSVEVMDSDITDWSRNAIQVQGDAMTAAIHDNTLTGPGDTLNADAVPNGILFIHDADGNATGNTISGMHTTASTSRSAGVLFFDPVTAGIIIEDNDISDVDDGVLLGHNSNDVIVRNNNLHDNAEVGIHIEDGTTNNTITKNTITGNDIAGIRFAGATDPGTPDTPPGAGNVANRNSVTGNAEGIVDYDSQTFDAECNWYGDASGPSGSGPGTGDSVNTNVDFDPWLISSNLDYACPALPDITVSDASGHDFGSRHINAGPSAPFTFTVTNDGDDDLDISTVTIVGAGAGHFGIDADNCGGETLAPDASCTIDTIFDPLTTGLKNATLRIGSNDPDENPVDRAISGTGTSGPTTGTIKIVLNAIPNSGQDFGFTGDLGSFVLDDGGNNSTPNSRTVTLVPGMYDVTQGAVSGWSLTGLSCNTGETTSVATRTATINLAAGENVVCTFTDTRRLVDGKISKKAGSGYVGNNIYSSTVLASQTRNRGIARNHTRSFFVQIENGSFGTDSFTVDANLSGSDSFTVRFFSGATEITASVLAGTYMVNNLAAGAHVTIEMRVTAAANTAASATRNVDVFMTSDSQPSVTDVVRGHITRG